MQRSLAANIWAYVTLSALAHAVVRWVVPGFYTATVEMKRKQKEERVRKREEAKVRSKGMLSMED